MALAQIGGAEAVADPFEGGEVEALDPLTDLEAEHRAEIEADERRQRRGRLDG